MKHSPNRRNTDALSQELSPSARPPGVSPGAPKRLAALRKETLAEIGLYELRRALDLSQTELAAELGVSQSAISQLERAEDLKLSTLRTYLERLGARLELLAVFEDDDEHAIPIRVGERVAS